MAKKSKVVVEEKPEPITVEHIADVNAIARKKVESPRKGMQDEGKAEQEELNKQFREQKAEPHPDWKK